MNTSSAQQPIQILIVEDDEDVIFLLRHMLEREDFSVDIAVDGQQAITYVDSQTPPDLVLLDIMLPYVDGFQIIEYIRNTESWLSTPVVMLTAKQSERDIVRALDAGANDYITKPFRPAELLARLRRQVGMMNQ